MCLRGLVIVDVILPGLRSCWFGCFDGFVRWCWIAWCWLLRVGFVCCWCEVFNIVLLRFVMITVVGCAACLWFGFLLWLRMLVFVVAGVVMFVVSHWWVWIRNSGVLMC